MNPANTALLERIRSLKADHPAWGYRRIWAYIRCHDQLAVNHKRVHRLMKLHGLLVPKSLRLKALRTPTRGKPRTVEPNRIWGIDMTKIRLSRDGWAYLHIVLDWGSKKIVGCQLSRRSTAADWLDALHQALNAQFPDGVRSLDRLPSLVSDNGCQPSSRRFVDTCRQLGLDQIFTSYDNPRGNADTERVMRTLKEDLVWPRDHQHYQPFADALAQWVHDYNHDFPHSTLGYQTPYQYETWFYAASHSA